MVEVYTKVVIASFGFVAPSFTILISIFLEGIERQRKKYEEEIVQTNRLIKEAVANADTTDDSISKTIKKSNERLRKQKKSATRRLNLLNPKRQVVRVFLILGLSILFIILYYWAKEFFCNKIWVSTVCIVSSIVVFIYSWYILWQLFCTIIETKTELINVKKEKASVPKINKTSIDSSNEE